MLIGGSVHVKNKFVQKWDKSVTQGVKVNNSTYESVKENKASWFDNVGKAVSFCGCNDLASATDNSCS